MILATARAPDGVARTDWPVSVAIPDRLHYEFQVRGPSRWRYHTLQGWRRQTPELVSEVPISNTHAYGGRVVGADDVEQVHEFNPSGIGLATRALLEAKEDIPIPQIGALGEFMGTDPLAEMTVHGFGPLAKAWLPRRSDAGTFADAWQRDRHLRMPLDYSIRFWNAAPGPLQLDPPLSGNEQINVTGFSRQADPIALSLPSISCSVDLTGEERVRVDMVLDTVTLDLQDEASENHTAALVWRAHISNPHRFDAGEVISERLES